MSNNKANNKKICRKKSVEEMDHLQEDSRNLLSSLKKNQAIFKDLLKKSIKPRDDMDLCSLDFYNCGQHQSNFNYEKFFDMDCRENLSISSESLDSALDDDDDDGLDDEDDDYASKRSMAKSVSFSDYLLTSKFSPRFRSRSISPNASHHRPPSKSILKKKRDDQMMSMKKKRGVMRSLSSLDMFRPDYMSDVETSSCELNEKKIIKCKPFNKRLNQTKSECNCDLYGNDVKCLKCKPFTSIQKPLVEAASKIMRSFSDKKSTVKKPMISNQEVNKIKKKPTAANGRKLREELKKNPTLLGYAWALDSIETKLNTTLSKFDKPEEYWEELSQFRDSNKHDCVSTKPIGFDGSSLFSTSCYEYDSRYLSGDDHYYHHQRDDNLESGDFDGRNHKCIHSFTLNERLFPVPVCKGKNGASTCPVCRSTRKEGNSFIPQFCKISIPKSYVLVSINFKKL